MSKKKQFKQRSCTSKVRHSNIESAKRIIEKVGTGLQVYRCRFCSGWHTGHSRSKQKWS